MRELKRSRKFENNSDVLYYDGYTKFTVPRVRGNQYNPMIVGEREELFNNILDSIDKKQTSPKYDDLFYVEGKNIDVGGGVEYKGQFSHSDDYTTVNIMCNLLDKNTGKELESFEKDLVIDYSDFMDSYGIESDIEDYILDELKKYMISILAQYDNKYKKENRTMRELKRNRMNEAYTSFTRWANAIERQYAKLDWSVATPKSKHPSCVWNGDIYCEFTDRSQDPWKHYIAGVSDSPDGQHVAVYVFEGYDAPYKEVMNDIVLRSQIEDSINKNKDKIPDELFNEMIKMFRMFKLK